MRFYKAKIILVTSFLVLGFLGTPAQAGDGVLYVAEDHTGGYDRALFNLWVDADKNGCDTRAEVLIKEAVVKPKKGTNCKLTGGKWVSSYDGVTYTDSSKLDIDHLVPLAEAWRSGAWAWTDKQREEYANYLENDVALNAVTASLNRSKGDKDIASWLPKKNICQYVAGWGTVKSYFNLTVDAAEAKVINRYYSTCGLGWITKQSMSSSGNSPISTSLPVPPNPVITYSDVTYYGAKLVLAKIAVVNSLYRSTRPWPFITGFSISTSSTLITPGTIKCFRGDFIEQTIDQRIAGGVFLPSGINTELFIDSFSSEDLVSCLLTPTLSFKISFKVRALGDVNNAAQKKSDEFEISATMPVPTPTPSPAQTPVSIVTPGAFCSPAGAIGKDSSSVTYICKTSPTDTRNRWRQ